ncbi:MAG: hypothetical protein HQ582_15040 [Planctomycetes bacterium]|nr:hypothetical protein [Planctomycetota bacterium]
METSDFVLLALSACDGEIKGKTKLQKTVYFLGLLTECSDVLAYHAHFYGPYSDKVVDALARLKAIQVLEEDSQPCGGTDERGFEVRRFDFRLNDQGRMFAETKAKQNPHLWERITTAVKAFRKAGNLDYVSLSVAAKTYYMLRQKEGRATEEELASLAPRFGWNVTSRQIHDAADYLQKLGLVCLSGN